VSEGSDPIEDGCELGSPEQPAKKASAAPSATTDVYFIFTPFAASKWKPCLFGDQGEE
jgi:hypothetical protein